MTVRPPGGNGGSEPDRDRFDDERELLDALYPVFERYRVERGSSVLGRVRSLLPF
jgi:hypothetical protein